MGNGYRIGRVLGIELRIDPSWLFIFVLITWSLVSLFASWHPSWSLAVNLSVASLASVMFFVSILLHELAHSTIALAYGIPVRDITLHLFGGVSNIEREPPTPGAELLIAIVGPIASIGLGLAMLATSAVLIDLRVPDGQTSLVEHLGPVETLLVWLGPVNIVVGVFNLIPGFPLDGGRVLRAIVWKATGNLERATWVAGGIGQIVGLGFVALGGAMAFGARVPFFGRGVTSGLWLAMIGIFLRNAAVAQVRGATVDRALGHVSVGDLMRVNGASVDQAVPVRQLVDHWFLRHDELAYPVIADERFVGIVSIEDLQKIHADDWGTKTVRDVMTPAPRLTVTSSTETLASALRKLSAANVQQLPVLEDGKLVGMLYERDISRWLQVQSQYPAATHARLDRVRHA